MLAWLLYLGLGELPISGQETDAHTSIHIENPYAIEGYLKNGERKLWYRVVNPKNRNTPLLVLHGGPGASSSYLEPLEKLADERPVILYDQLGGGWSSIPDETYEWTVDVFVEDLVALRRHLNLSRIHLLGHSWGAALMTAYPEKQPMGIESLTMVGPHISTRRWIADAKILLEAFPEETQAILSEHNATGTFDSEEYHDATMVFMQRYFCRLDPWPPRLLEAVENIGPVYEEMFGPNEFVVNGVLKDFDKTDVLKTISVPTLLIGGEHDEAPPETVKVVRSDDSRVGGGDHSRCLPHGHARTTNDL